MPNVPQPVGNYLPFKIAENIIYINQIALVNGEIETPGIIGDNVSEEEARTATRVTMLNVLAVLKHACEGELNKVKQAIQLTGYFNTAKASTNHALIMDEASNLLVKFFGEKGKHTRVTIGASSLPKNSPVEIQAIFELVQLPYHPLAEFISHTDEAHGEILRKKVNTLLDSGLSDYLKIKVAIVGAGTAGLYCGYRLMSDTGSKYKPGEVQIFEMDNRIGGRLESVQIADSNLIGELGGMRYLNSQKIIATLVKKLNLTPQDFPMGDDPESQSRLLAYYRKDNKKANAWKESRRQDQKLVTEYNLNTEHLGFTADELFNKVIYEVLMENRWFQELYGSKLSKHSEYDYEFRLTRKDWDDIKLNVTYDFKGSPYTGRKLNNLGFWNILKERVSQEGYNFLSDAGGYYSNTINWNAAEALPYMVGDFTANPKYYTIKGGYDLIAYKLAEEFLTQDGNKIWTQNKLMSFKHNTQGGGYVLKFWNSKHKRPWVIQAENIILAMPRRALELLDQHNFFFQDEKLQFHLRSVICEPSFKALLVFSKPWWRAELNKPCYGRSITDLPLRQCYYFDTDERNGYSLLLATYNDMATVPFWSSLAYEPSFADSECIDSENKIMENTLFFEREKVFKPEGRLSIMNNELQDPYKCSEVMVLELMKQLRELHPGIDIPEPYQVLYKDWSKDPYGGGYHAWQARYRVHEVMPYMRRPSQEAIFICGEAYSNQQGWVEGAFCEAEKMLQEHFDLKSPEWLPNDENGEKYYLSW